MVALTIAEEKLRARHEGDKVGSGKFKHWREWGKLLPGESEAQGDSADTPPPNGPGGPNAKRSQGSQTNIDGSLPMVNGNPYTASPYQSSGLTLPDFGAGDPFDLASWPWSSSFDEIDGNKSGSYKDGDNLDSWPWPSSFDEIDFIEPHSYKVRLSSNHEGSSENDSHKGDATFCEILDQDTPQMGDEESDIHSFGKTYLESDGMSTFNLDGAPEEQSRMEVKDDDVPFTDSGYKSAPNLEHCPIAQPDLEKSPHPLNVNSSLAREDGDDNDAKTLYSMGTTVNSGHAQTYIIELSKDIYSKLRQSVHAKDLGVLLKVLPELVKAFAIKLCYDAPSQVNRKIMHFIHKRHQ